MASIQCTKCKTGIHYHGQPKGIEYIFIKECDWDKITSSSFDPKNKQYKSESFPPMLFQADTIEADFEELIEKAWKCPECGCIMIFDVHGRVVAAYQEDGCEERENCDISYNYIVFDDYSWDILTDSTIPNWKIPERISPNIRASITDSKLILCQNDGNVVKTYTKCDNPSK